MNTKSEVGFIPVGLALGVGVGSWVGDVRAGVCLGLIAGSTAASLVEWRKHRRGPLWFIIGTIALACIAGVRIVEVW